MNLVSNLKQKIKRKYKMKKCAVVYTKNKTNEEYWALSVDEKGCTYCLRQKITSIPQSHNDATEFYGKNRIKQAQNRINTDKKYRKWYGYTANIIEYEREPEWYFELCFVLKNMGDKCFSEVRKHFPLDKNINYKIREGYNRPLIDDLPLEELERYYAWRKNRYRGKKKV